uniref:Sodium channel modifier 1 zinc-finger domain-containing protein n=1 Tax=Anas platyrhynchos TaxID=8839 RepID=A0A8B9SHQ2_ANAPL
MSFKRDGDEPGQLAALQKRRVAELLASYIPEEEALLLRSGRYACTVCAHRPVFDTLEVLAVHRAGRKHLGSLQRCYGSERWREDTAQEQRHQELVRVEAAGTQGSPAPLLARTRRIAQSALLKAAPYNSCCRRTGAAGSGARGARTQPGLSTAQAPSQHRDTVEATPAALLPGQRSRQAGEGKLRQDGAPGRFLPFLRVSPSCAPLRSPRCTEGSFHPRRARQKRESSSIVLTAESARGPQPREAPGAGAIPAAAEVSWALLMGNPQRASPHPVCPSPAPAGSRIALASG